MPAVLESIDIQTPNFSDIGSPTIGLLDTALFISINLNNVYICEVM